MSAPKKVQQQFDGLGRVLDAAIAVHCASHVTGELYDACEDLSRALLAGGFVEERKALPGSEVDG